MTGLLKNKTKVVAIQIFSETKADAVAQLFSSICGYEVLVGEKHELKSAGNIAVFVLGYHITKIQHAPYPNYNPMSNIAMDVYDSGHTNQSPIGEDLKSKIRVLWGQLERPVAFHTDDLCFDSNKPLSIDDL